MSAWDQAAALFGGTFVSEDLSCIAAGVLINTRALSWHGGVFACVLGIFVSDMGLWLAGRLFGSRLLAWPWLHRRLPDTGLPQLQDWFDKHGWKAIIASRFLPGSRLPMYVAAGVLGRNVGHFAFWAFLAAAIWTPLVVLTIATFGTGVIGPMQRAFGGGLFAFATAIVVLWAAVQIVTRCATERGRAQVWAGISRIWRWEFWPSWLFYLPLLPWIAYLAIRHRGLTTLTAANPGISPHGGIVGESKIAILSKLPPEWIVSSAIIESGTTTQREEVLKCLMASRGWRFPIIFKPDAGQRGASVRLIRDMDAASRYLESHPQSLVAQEFHPGPYEAGIFYSRMPGHQRGCIFSITDKQFPVLVGDGASTVESLIWRHPRFCMQASIFLARLKQNAKRVLAAGETMPLAIAGNHCQGTLFRDGSHLITSQLEQRIDEIAHSFGGFFFGRFDVRYSNLEEFMAGRDLKIIELNGVTSESTNLYDPSWSICRAYQVLFRQWATLFAIGDRNRKLGHRRSTIREVVSDARSFYRSRHSNLLSD